MNQQLPFLGCTQCACCDKTFPANEAVVLSYKVSEAVTEQEHFCSEHCKQHWYIGRLRSVGL